jgi:hypothetical protein
MTAARKQIAAMFGQARQGPIKFVRDARYSDNVNNVILFLQEVWPVEKTTKEIADDLSTSKDAALTTLSTASNVKIHRVKRGTGTQHGNLESATWQYRPKYLGKEYSGRPECTGYKNHDDPEQKSQPANCLSLMDRVTIASGWQHSGGSAKVGL